jgi:hypothetical protein
MTNWTDDDSTIYTPKTPPSTIAPSTIADDDGPAHQGASISFSVPWPGNTFIIRDMSSGNVLTLLDGQVVLSPLGGRGSIHWRCVDNKGWIGFQNTISGKYLGHSFWGWLVCDAWQPQGYERFCVRLLPLGGFTLMMTHWDKLWRVGLARNQHGEMKLAKVENGHADGVAWEFTKV